MPEQKQESFLNKPVSLPLSTVFVLLGTAFGFTGGSVLGGEVKTNSDNITVEEMDHHKELEDFKMKSIYDKLDEISKKIDKYHSE